MSSIAAVANLASANPSSTVLVSTYFTWAELDFLPEYTTKINGMCVSGEFACTYGKTISAALSWLIIAVFFFILIKIVACKKREAKFLSFYNFYKGFMYWFFGLLIYAATDTLLKYIDGTTSNSKDLYGSAIVIGGFVVIGIVELIAYKVAQRE